MNFWKTCFKLSGWTTVITTPYRDKVIICVAPHTSNWDFILGLFAYRSVGRKASFLMKEFWFFFPLKYLLLKLGGIPVKKSSVNLTDLISEDFKRKARLNLAITPEGTRKAVKEWRTGFLQIAYKAHVNIQLGVIDYKNKKVIINQEYHPIGDLSTDLKNIREYYSHFRSAAKYPEKYIY